MILYHYYICYLYSGIYFLFYICLYLPYLQLKNQNPFVYFVYSNNYIMKIGNLIMKIFNFNLLKIKKTFFMNLESMNYKSIQKIYRYNLQIFYLYQLELE